MAEKAPWPDSTPEEDAAYALEAQMWDMEFERDVVEQGGPQLAGVVDPEHARLLPTKSYTVQGIYRPEDEEKSIMEVKRYAPLARELEEKGIEPPGRDVAAVVGGASATPQIWAHEFGHRRVAQKGGGGNERWRLIHDAFRSDTPTEWADAVTRWWSWNRRRFTNDPEIKTYRDVEENLKGAIAASRNSLLNAEVEAREERGHEPKKREGFFTIESLRKDQEDQMEFRAKSWSVEKYNADVKRRQEHKAVGGKVTVPSKTPKQAKFMRAIAHGWNPSRMKSPPSRAVAQEFVEADRKYSGGFAENRYWRGGLAAMDSPTAGYKGRIDWQEGGDVDPQLQRRIENTLGSARGGHVNYYEEGGEVRPGHAEGQNPHDQSKTPGMYGDWERRYHKDPTVEVPEAEPETLSVWERLARFAKAAPRSDVELAELEAAEQGNAYGGRVRYQTGGLAIAAPAGGVPPWIAPTGGLDTEYMDPQGYQFGGAARMGGAGRMMQNYRGVPPQRGGIQRGAPPGGGRGRFPSRFQRRGPQRGAAQPGGGQPQGGGLAAMMRQIQQQRAQQGGGGAPGGGGFVPAGATRDPATGLIKFGGYDPLSGGRPGQYGSEGDPSQPGYDDRSYEDFAAQQRQQGPGITDEVIRSRYGDRNANQGAIFTSGMGGPGRVGEVSAGGGMYTDPNHPNYSPPGSGGSFDMSGKYTPPTRGPLTGVDPTGGRPWGGGGGKPRPGPGMMPPGSGGDEGGGGIPGGPRVPPNMRGYLQKQRMMNRAPANVGGGANRVGMQDQQGALSRAMQRGTGRAPPSRRFGSGRAGAGRGFQQP